MKMIDPDARRRLANKRFNERVKLAYTTLNAMAIAVVAAAFIVPGISSVASIFELQRMIWFLVAAALHSAAQMFVGALRSEE